MNIPHPDPRQLPPRILVNWRRFSSGLWRIQRGDIDEAYSGDTFPKVRAFSHDGRLFTNMGCHWSDIILASADCYPLLPADAYRGPEPRRYGYEGEKATHLGRSFRLGPKTVFAASDPTLAEWTTLLRVLYADGGYFASGCTYREFLGRRGPRKSENGRAAHASELTECEIHPMPRTQEEMRRLLEQAADGPGRIVPSRQIEFAFT